MNIPTKLNGYPITRSAAHANCATVMMHDTGNSRFIVATWWPELGASWSWGHYHHYTDDVTRSDAMDDADASFADAAKSNATR